jgi:hypothetical protein
VPVQSKLEKVSNANQVVRGFRERFSGTDELWVDGKRLRVDDVVARYQAQLEAIQRVTVAWAAWQTALKAERAMRKPMRELTVALKAAVLQMLGPRVLASFGWKKPRKPGPKTVKAKLAGVQKRAGKRR